MENSIYVFYFCISISIHQYFFFIYDSAIVWNGTIIGKCCFETDNENHVCNRIPWKKKNVSLKIYRKIEKKNKQQAFELALFNINTDQDSNFGKYIT